MRMWTTPKKRLETIALTSKFQHLGGHQHPVVGQSNHDAMTPSAAMDPHNSTAQAQYADVRRIGKVEHAEAE